MRGVDLSWLDLGNTVCALGSTTVVKKRLDLGASLDTLATDRLGYPLQENALTSSACWRRQQIQRFASNRPIESFRRLTGH